MILMIDTIGSVHIWRNSSNTPFGWARPNNYSKMVMNTVCLRYFWCSTCYSLIIKRWSSLLLEEEFILVTKNSVMYFEDYITEQQFNEIFNSIDPSKRLRAVSKTASNVLRKGRQNKPPNPLYPGL